MALWKMVAALAFTITMSATMIIFNAMLLQGFRHPVWLTFWHQSVSTCCVLLVRCAKPSLVTITSDENHEPLGVLGALWLGAPIACMQSVGLICGNTAVMYLSVGFCQMIKAWTASAVYVVGCFVGTQVWYRAVAKTLVIITSGLMITSIGELKFDAYGFLMQVLALFAEAFRINLVETRLKSAGYKLNPLSSVLATAPVASFLLLLIGLIFDRDALNAQALEAIGWPKLVANGLVAFFLNVAIFLAISVCSGLVYSLAGIVKDISIILGSVLIMGSSVSSLQVVGYSVAIGGIQTYGLVSKEPAKFDSAGLCIGLWQHLSLMSSPGTLLAVAPQSIGVDEQQWEKKKEVELEDLEAGDAHREPDSGSASRSACSEKRLLDAATDSSGSADSRRRHVNSEGNNGDGL